MPWKDIEINLDRVRWQSIHLQKLVASHLFRRAFAGICAKGQRAGGIENRTHED